MYEKEVWWIRERIGRGHVERREAGVGSSMERSVPLVVEGDDWGVEGFGGGFHLVRDPGFFFDGWVYQFDEISVLLLDLL